MKRHFYLSCIHFWGDMNKIFDTLDFMNWKGGRSTVYMNMPENKMDPWQTGAAAGEAAADFTALLQQPAGPDETYYSAGTCSSSCLGEIWDWLPYFPIIIQSLCDSAGVKDPGPAALSDVLVSLSAGCGC